MTTRAFHHEVDFQVLYSEPQLSRAGHRLGTVQGSVFYGPGESPGAIYSSLISVAKQDLDAGSVVTEHLGESPPCSLTPSICWPEEARPAAPPRTWRHLCSEAVCRLPGSPDLFLPQWAFCILAFGDIWSMLSLLSGVEPSGSHLCQSEDSVLNPFVEARVG